MGKFSDVSMQSSKGPSQDLKVDSEVDGGTCEDSEDLVRSLAAAFWTTCRRSKEFYKEGRTVSRSELGKRRGASSQNSSVHQHRDEQAQQDDDGHQQESRVQDPRLRVHHIGPWKTQSFHRWRNHNFLWLKQKFTHIIRNINGCTSQIALHTFL